MLVDHSELDGVARRRRPGGSLLHRGLAAAVILGGGLLAGGAWWLWPTRHPFIPELLTDTSSIGPDGAPVAGVLARAATPASGISRSAPVPIPDKPSIAVLPFTAMGGEPDLGYFGDGIAEDLMTRLSQYPDLLVTGRNSTASTHLSSLNGTAT